MKLHYFLQDSPRILKQQNAAVGRQFAASNRNDCESEMKAALVVRRDSPLREGNSNAVLYARGRI